MVSLIRRFLDVIDFIFVSCCPGNGIFSIAVLSVLLSGVKNRGDLCLLALGTYLSIFCTTLLITWVGEHAISFIDKQRGR
jgi:uncharacterized membrane protein